MIRQSAPRPGAGRQLLSGLTAAFGYRPQLSESERRMQIRDGREIRLYAVSGLAGDPHLLLVGHDPEGVRGDAIFNAAGLFRNLSLWWAKRSVAKQIKGKVGLYGLDS